MASLPCCQLPKECNQYFIRYNDGLEAFHHHLLSDYGRPFLLLVFRHVLTGMGTKFCQISVNWDYRVYFSILVCGMWQLTLSDFFKSTCTESFHTDLHPWTASRLVTAGQCLRRLLLSVVFCRWCLSLCSGGVLVYNPFPVMPLRPWCQGHTTLRKQADKYSSSCVFWNVWWMVDIMFSFLIKCLVEFTSEVFGCGVFLRRAFISDSLSLTNWRPLKFIFLPGSVLVCLFCKEFAIFPIG